MSSLSATARGAAPAETDTTVAVGGVLCGRKEADAPPTAPCCSLSESSESSRSEVWAELPTPLAPLPESDSTPVPEDTRAKEAE